jgi:XTP/dITP diphosphohydrolase
VTGERVLDLVAVMDRLRSPGGCPWDAEQTHESLLQYLIEECYETVEAVETGDRAGLREELGDLLLQVVFHARVAAEDPDDPFDIDDVAAGITTKLTRRHPHVFGDATAADAADVQARWETLKAAEKGRTSAMDGVPLAQPALALAAKVQARARRVGVGPRVAPAQLPEDAELGDALFALVALAAERGEDPEAALRASVRRFVAAVRAAESQA